ncbi:MAG: hypothetical protein IJ867_07980 [Clostridia bacterium]|nr:hypothetical protein [Clostridia bacterium]
MNNYIPMYVCLGVVVISTILSLGFKDVYKVKEKYSFKKHRQDIKRSFAFAFRSKRMRSLILFQMVFYSLIKLIKFYSSDLLVEIGIPEQQFAIIFAALTFIGGVSIFLKNRIEKTFKNRVLTFISVVYILSCLIIGVTVKKFEGFFVIPVILVLLAVMQSCESIWYILESKYLKNFTEAETRNKITFAYEFIGTTSASIVSVLGGILLEYVDVTDGFIVIGLGATVCVILVLDYMRKRFGLKPEEYSDKDIEF